MKQEDMNMLILTWKGRRAVYTSDWTPSPSRPPLCTRYEQAFGFIWLIRALKDNMVMPVICLLQHAL